MELPLLIMHGDSIQAAPRTHPTIEIDPIAQLSLADLRGVRVLLVDDDRDALEMARDALAVAGAEVLTASSGSEALAVLDRRRIDVLILDIGMPAIDGYEVIRQVRRRPAKRNGQIPAAATSADGPPLPADPSPVIDRGPTSVEPVVLVSAAEAEAFRVLVAAARGGEFEVAKLPEPPSARVALPSPADLVAPPVEIAAIAPIAPIGN